MTDYILSQAVSTTIAVSALILLVMLIRKPVAQKFGAQAAYALWALPLLRLVLPPLPASWTTPLSVFQSLTPRAEKLTADAAPLPIAAPAPAPTTENTFLVIDPVATTVSPTAQSFVNWPLMALALWVLGAAAIIGYVVYRQYQFHQLIKREAELAPLDFQEMTHVIARKIGLKKTPVVYQSLISKSPMVTGLAHPIILLPAWFEEDYTPTEQHAAILHELTHIKRGDLWALPLSYLFLASQWFNPLAYFALRKFKSDQEAACDATLLATGETQTRDYAGTLVKAVKLASPVSTPALAAGLPPTHEMKERLTLMQNATPTLTARRLGIALITTCSAAGLFLTSTNAAAEKNIFISENSFSVNGKELKDRRMVLLSDPFKDIEPQLEMLEDIEMPEFEMPEIEMPEMPEPPEPKITEEKVEGGTRIVHEIFIPDNMEEIEKAAEAAALKAEQYAELHEKYAAEVEAKIDAIMTDEFEAKIEEASTIVEDIADQCMDSDFENGPFEIISANTSENESIKAVCVQGDRKVLYSDELEEFIEKADLTSDERRKFYHDRGGKIEFSRD
jgi:beta-lactamase regulating signal transducer with metallopeptidase domain